MIRRIFKGLGVFRASCEKYLAPTCWVERLGFRLPVKTVIQGSFRPVNELIAACAEMTTQADCAYGARIFIFCKRAQDRDPSFYPNAFSSSM
jgi:hypothetical protein